MHFKTLVSILCQVESSGFLAENAYDSSPPILALCSALGDGVWQGALVQQARSC